MKNTILVAAIASVVASPVVLHAEGHNDFGLKVQKMLEDNSWEWFGIKKPLAKSAEATSGAYRTETQTVDDQVKLAEGLTAHYITRNAANKTDMFAFWPSEWQTDYVITCVEGGREVIGKRADGSDKYNPSVQRIHIASGKVETILRGMNRCDGIRATAWGTVLATEESNDGAGYEILDPIGTTEETVTDRGEPGKPAEITTATIKKMTALPTMAWEGLAVLDSGVVIAGDELRPGTAETDIDGGALYKFIPAKEWGANNGHIKDLADSPFMSGNSYAMQVSCRDSKQQYGQGCEVGNGAWIEVDPAKARPDAAKKGATGYYRPEDLHKDPRYADYENPEAVRFCWTNTGNEGAKHYGEIMCGIDSAPMMADADKRSVVVNRFVEGDSELNSPDNFAFQPNTGNHYIVEDHKNGDIWACLPDGKDRDIKSDGCVRVISVKDSSAEPTGFEFTGSGSTAYLSIQHSNDDNMPKYDDYGTDDFLVIRGWDYDYKLYAQ